MIETLLEIGLPTYLDETVRQDGETVTPGTPGVQPWNSLQTHPITVTEELAEDALPRLVVVDGGTIGAPYGPDSNGLIGHTWRIGIAVEIAGASMNDAQAKAGAYGASIRALMTHHLADFHDQVSLVQWTSSAPATGTALLGAERRSIAAVEEQFAVRVDGVLRDDSELTLPGPGDEPVDPADPGDSPVITQTDLTVHPSLEIEDA
ncbi:hypothetical protein [Patulibacter minatonensis]|uniref:hypothetical protein n=1 Tax=Patulibacter minatonensis TaxID=298163 RepID=UPI0012F825FF|nr:hypothetical protein [Patulibacter minatonensis]